MVDSDWNVRIFDFFEEVHVGTRIEPLLYLVVVERHLLFEGHVHSATMGWNHSILIVLALLPCWLWQAVLAHSIDVLVSVQLHVQSILAKVIPPLLLSRARVTLIQAEGRGGVLNDLFVFVDPVEYCVEFLGRLAVLLDVFVDLLR